MDAPPSPAPEAAIKGCLAVEFGVSAPAAKALHRAAMHRGVSVAEIARRVVEAAAVDDLVKAILDDGKRR